MVHRLAEALREPHWMLRKFCLIDIPPINGNAVFYDPFNGYSVETLADYTIIYGNKLCMMDGKIILTGDDGTRTAILPAPNEIDLYAHIRDRQAAGSANPAIHRGAGSED